MFYMGEAFMQNKTMCSHSKDYRKNQVSYIHIAITN